MRRDRAAERACPAGLRRFCTDGFLLEIRTFDPMPSRAVNKSQVRQPNFALDSPSNCAFSILSRRTQYYTIWDNPPLLLYYKKILKGKGLKSRVLSLPILKEKAATESTLVQAFPEISVKTKIKVATAGGYWMRLGLLFAMQLNAGRLASAISACLPTRKTIH